MQELPSHVKKCIAGVRFISLKCFGKPHRDASGKITCWWCRGPVKSPRKSWCSDSCVDQYKELVFARENVIRRDKGICQNCKVDTKEIANTIEEIAPLITRRDSLQNSIDWAQSRPYYDQNRLLESRKRLVECNREIESYTKEYPRLFKQKKGFFYLVASHALEVDHVIPIEKGGSSVVTNLETLCLPCHKDKTTEATKMRAKNKKVQRGCPAPCFGGGCGNNFKPVKT